MMSQGRNEEALDRLAGDAEAMRRSADRLSEETDVRTRLAADRTIFAAERTYAAWMRTGLAALASGVGARALLKGLVADWMVGFTGSLLIFFCAFCFVAALWREVFPGPPPPQPDARRLPFSLLLIMNGFLILVALAALVGVWSGVDPSR